VKGYAKMLPAAVTVLFLWCAPCPASPPGVQAQTGQRDGAQLQRNQRESELPDGTNTQSPADSTGAQPSDQRAPDDTVQPLGPEAGSETTPYPPSNSPAKAADQTALELLNSRIGPNYLIGPEDVITIDVFDVPDLSKFDAQVANDGTISVPLLGSVKAAGLTQAELRDELNKEWGEKYLNHPQVSLYLKDSKSRPVSVVGSVAKPGMIYLTSRRTLVEVLAMAGGLASVGAAAGKEVYVERPGGFQGLPAVKGLTQTAPDKVSIELKKLLYSQETKLNIEIEPFDIVTVSRAGIVYLAGAFTKPGGYVLDNKDSVTALEAVAMAQGLSPNARTSQARIIRRSGSGATTETTIDLKKILQAKTPDVTLADNDILFVPNSNAKAITKSTVSSVISIVSGMAIYGGL
jgi:polysaccharide biosynthesis/export protein